MVARPTISSGGCVDRGYATAQPCRNNSARVFHIHSKPLYAAIGEPDNRHRKPTPLPRAIERLMVLDAVLADRGRTWLATEQDKLTHFTLTHRIPRQDLPSLIFRSEDTETARYFPDKMPIGVDRDGDGYVFVYAVTRPGPVDFRAFLERHAELLRTLRTWTIRLLVPPHFAQVMGMYRSAFHEQLAMPLRPMNLDDLRWYFHARQATPQGSDERFDQAARAFSAPRFRVLYQGLARAGRTSPRCDVIARAGGQDCTPGGSVGVPCSPTSVSAPLVLGGHGLIRLSRGQRGGQSPGADSSAFSSRRDAASVLVRTPGAPLSSRQLLSAITRGYAERLIRARHTPGGVLCRPNGRGCDRSRGVSDPPRGRPRPSRPRPGGSLTPRLRVLSVRTIGPAIVPTTGPAMVPARRDRLVASRAQGPGDRRTHPSWKEW